MNLLLIEDDLEAAKFLQKGLKESGYSVAVTQNRGVGYAVVSDLDPDKSAQLALALEE